MNKTIAIAVLLTATVLLGAFLLKVPATVTERVTEKLGANPGPTFNCTTATWNPAAIDIDSNSTTSVTVIGANKGDLILASLNTTSSQEGWTVTGNVTSTNTIIVTLSSLGSTSIDIVPSSLKTCYSKSYQ